jgi:ParB family chromosome partitioning protein
MDQFKLTQEELSLKVGKSRSHIANFLRLLSLPEEVKDDVSRGTLSMGHARALAGLKDIEIIKDLAKQCIDHEWSVRQLEDAVQQLDRSKKQKAKVQNKKRDPYIDEVEEYLRERYKTTVKIKPNKDKGKIEIAYYNQQDLQRLLDLLNG